jgi:hypothetical protein
MINFAKFHEVSCFFAIGVAWNINNLSEEKMYTRKKMSTNSLHRITGSLKQWLYYTRGGLPVWRGTMLLKPQDGSCTSSADPLISRKKRYAFTTFLREEYKSGAHKRGKAVGYSVDHRSLSRKTGLPALKCSMPAVWGLTLFQPSTILQT